MDGDGDRTGDAMRIGLGMGMGCWDSQDQAAGPWLGSRSPVTAEISSVVLSACVEEGTGCLKQAAMILPCLLSLPAFFQKQGERISSCHLSGGIFKPARQRKSEEQ